MKLSPIYFITDARPISLLHPLIYHVLKSGITTIQLRDKLSSPKHIKEKALAILPLIQKYRANLIINDHLDIAYDLGLGVHLGMEDGDPLHARKLLGSSLPIGITIHNQLQRAQKYHTVANYVGVGPIFPTSTKKDARAVIGTEQLSTILTKSPLPVVAIGGIGLNNITKVAQARPQSIALCSAICQALDPFKTAQRLLKLALV